MLTSRQQRRRQHAPFEPVIEALCAPPASADERVKSTGRLMVVRAEKSGSSRARMAYLLCSTQVTAATLMLVMK